MSILSSIREEHLFIENVLNFLPAEMRCGYEQSDNTTSPSEGAGRGSQKRVPQRASKKSGTTQPIYNDSGQLVFSKFDFACADVVQSHSQQGKRRRGQSLHAQMARAKRQKEDGEQQGEGERWKTALVKAEGGKVRDDPRLLARSIRRRRERKQRSRATWSRRVQQQQQQQTDKQQKRSENMRRRRETRNTTKINRLKKKGRILPGF